MTRKLQLFDSISLPIIFDLMEQTIWSFFETQLCFKNKSYLDYVAVQNLKKYLHSFLYSVSKYRSKIPIEKIVQLKSWAYIPHEEKCNKLCIIVAM